VSDNLPEFGLNSLRWVPKRPGLQKAEKRRDSGSSGRKWGFTKGAQQEKKKERWEKPLRMNLSWDVPGGVNEGVLETDSSKFSDLRLARTDGLDKMRLHHLALAPMGNSSNSNHRSDKECQEKG